MYIGSVESECHSYSDHHCSGFYAVIELGDGMYSLWPPTVTKAPIL